MPASLNGEGLMPAVTSKYKFEECDWEFKTYTIKDYFAPYRIHVKARHPESNTPATSRTENARTPELTPDGHQTEG